MPPRLLLAALTMAWCSLAQAATQVLALHYRTSAELLPIAQSFLGREGNVQAYGNQLVVSAEPSKIDELTALLERIDRPARRLLISVDTRDSNHSDASGYTLNNGEQGRIIRYGTANRSGGVQQVQTTEGTPALIQVGQSVPVTSTRSDGYGAWQSDTQYRNATRGFYVTASVTGDQVHLAISSNDDRVSQQRPDVINVQSTATQVTGHLGEWITLAGVNENSQADQNTLAKQYSTEGRTDMTLRVKVDALQ
ncbi:secretin N-terminal domain-containing protein [Pseudomonas typographi]|uniref:secretin N-terminal domain-containing protein n=1 Tax=Pseudomonas typographi TaxID=2715964 RepID=UPI001686F9E1|nr:secretin N-terminal domain-containing protein [Pseudomonas typographi]MBD1554063.1 secretin [Pseudomonas typographi]